MVIVVRKEWNVYLSPVSTIVIFPSCFIVLYNSWVNTSYLWNSLRYFSITILIKHAFSFLLSWELHSITWLNPLKNTKYLRTRYPVVQWLKIRPEALPIKKNLAIEIPWFFFHWENEIFQVMTFFRQHFTSIYQFNQY